MSSNKGNENFIEKIKDSIKDKGKAFKDSLYNAFQIDSIYDKNIDPKRNKNERFFNKNALESYDNISDNFNDNFDDLSNPIKEAYDEWIRIKNSCNHSRK